MYFVKKFVQERGGGGVLLAHRALKLCNKTRSSLEVEDHIVESNANKQNLLFEFVCIRFCTCELRLNRT